MNPARLRLLTMRMSYAIETAAQFNHATSRRIRHGFARYLLAELRAMHTELAELHREAWTDDEVPPLRGICLRTGRFLGSNNSCGCGDCIPGNNVDTPEQRAAVIAARRKQTRHG